MAAALAAAVPVANGKEDETMNDYVIDVAQVEELQTLNDREALEKIFEKARSAIVNGAGTVLIRKTAGRKEAFDEFTTLPDLEVYKKTVFKYL